MLTAFIQQLFSLLLGTFSIQNFYLLTRLCCDECFGRLVLTGRMNSVLWHIALCSAHSETASRCLFFKGFTCFPNFWRSVNVPVMVWHDYLMENSVFIAAGIHSYMHCPTQCRSEDMEGFKDRRQFFLSFCFVFAEINIGGKAQLQQMWDLFVSWLPF